MRIARITATDADKTEHGTEGDDIFFYDKEYHDGFYTPSGDDIVLVTLQNSF